MTNVKYRLVRGYGGALRIMESMTLSDDAEARDWYWRRWGNDESVRLQSWDGEIWKAVPKALLKDENA